MEKTIKTYLMNGLWFARLDVKGQTFLSEGKETAEAAIKDVQRNNGDEENTETK